MSSVVVTGGAGFLGWHISRALADAGHSVRVLDRFQPRGGLHSEIEIVIGDVGDRDVLERVLNGADVVVHLACTTIPQTSEEDRIYDLRSNVEPALALLECACRAGVRRFVFASSGGTIYGQPRVVPIPEDHPLTPLCSHGVMKLTIEHYIRVYQRLRRLEGIALRMGNPYGPGQATAKPQGFIAVMSQRARSGEEIELWGDGRVIRDFVYVEDVAQAFVRVVSGAGSEGAYNIGSGEGHSLTQVLSIAEQVLGRKVAVRHLAARAIDVATNVLDISKAARDLGWVPRTTLFDGIRKMLGAS
jgi:UDP-glucose 4-epimerase